MKFLFVGHRGSGKTTCLEKLQEIFIAEKREAEFFDLDREIESRHGNIFDLFKNQGEATFRKWEKETFEHLLSGVSGKDVFLAAGAGFRGPIPEGFEVIWVRRESDRQGRVFLDRPSLNPELAPLEEWKKRFPLREEMFQEIHHQVLTLPEGDWSLSKVLRAFFSSWYPDLSVQKPVYDATLLPEDFKQGRWEKKFFYRKARKLEVREDWLSSKEQAEVKEKVPPSGIYYSRRKKGSGKDEFGDFRDWDLSLGEPPGDYWSYSLHEGEFKTGRDGILKWAPEVKSFKELYFGHQWMAGDPKCRAFLPRSVDGRWRWYRRLFSAESPIYFVRENKGSSLDQPFWYETLLPRFGDQGFAAVLGGEVSLSWTPSFHADFFGRFKMPVVAINMNEGEFEDALFVLKKLGLRAAAVTSPMKHKAFRQVTDFETAQDQALGSINTLVIQGKRVRGTNTDLTGLGRAAEKGNLFQGKTVVWGGGGMLPILKEVFPQAEFAQARKGLPLTEDSLIVWSSLRSAQVKWPEPLEKVKMVFDLNYAENSMGKELALNAGCSYVSGRELFESQAKAQQDFWKHHLFKGL